MPALKNQSHTVAPIVSLRCMGKEFVFPRLVHALLAAVFTLQAFPFKSLASYGFPAPGLKFHRMALTLRQSDLPKYY